MRPTCRADLVACIGKKLGQQLQVGDFIIDDEDATDIDF
jgi:hypothetical protein